ITKTYFPRILLPASAILASLIDFGIAFLVLIGFIIFYGVYPGLAIFTLPLFILLLVLAAFGVSLWLAAFNVMYRDVRYVLPFLTQIWMFATPIIYPVSVVPDSWRLLYSLNPMVGVVEGFRWALLDESNGMDVTIGLSVFVVAGVLGAGVLYFQSVQQTFADVI
ncbi:MAG TPA: ABC transporter permease, partial [Candidatus Binatia bacterium]|nr:ABC transporter permease [Candidatus Binatia bacterium]